MSSPVPSRTCGATAPVPADPERPLTPHEARARLPFRPHLTSDGLGWPDGVVLESYRAMPPGELHRPAEDWHRLVFITGAAPGTRVGWRLDGRERPEGPVTPGPSWRFCLVPAGSARQWHWRGGTFDCLTLSLSRGFLGGVAGEMGLDSARVELPGKLEHEDATLSTPAGWMAAELAGAGGAGAADGTGLVGGPVTARALATLLCAALLRRHAVAAPPTKHEHEVLLSPKAVARAKEMIEAGVPGGAPTVAELALVAGCSPGHFARGFKAATGRCPHDYLLGRRLDKARGLLLNAADLSVAEVAHDAGFNNQSHMGELFRRAFGATPAAFRRASQKTRRGATCLLPLLSSMLASPAADGPLATLFF